MEEIAKISLENEMDLILAHKRGMKLAELCGLSLAAQTTFATAVSEISRIAIDGDTPSHIILGIKESPTQSMLCAVIHDDHDERAYINALTYARRLVDQANIKGNKGRMEIELTVRLPKKILKTKAAAWIEYFNNDTPLSPYEEIKRKNELLQRMAEQIKESEGDYKVLTDTLPMMMFSMSNEGQLTYASKWFLTFTGYSLFVLNESKWQKVLHPDDYTTFWAKWNNRYKDLSPEIKGQCRLKNFLTDEYVWHLLSITPIRDDQNRISSWIGYIVDINAQKQVEETLKDNNELKLVRWQLEKKQTQLEQKIRELNRSNTELSQFAYVASHDLQEPLRKLMLYSDRLSKEYAGQLDANGQKMLENLITSSNRMQGLILDLLALSRLNSQEVVIEEINLNELIVPVLQNVEVTVREKDARISVSELPVIIGNAPQLRQLFQNLISNSLKFSKPDVAPVIDIWSEYRDNLARITIKDNGIGFEQKYADKIFGLFQRLHNKSHYQGNGMGLTICKKIVELHQGHITAEGEPDGGCTFIIDIPYRNAEQKEPVNE